MRWYKGFKKRRLFISWKALNQKATANLQLLQNDIKLSFKLLSHHFSPTLTERISKCESQPCQNEGTCIEDEIDGFHCTCSGKYQGKHCEGILSNVV